jgi:hypothetical protein
MNLLAPSRLVAKYLGKIRTLRNEARTTRLIASLPRSIQKDIGWPDGYPSRRPLH